MQISFAVERQKGYAKKNETRNERERSSRVTWWGDRMSSGALEKRKCKTKL